MSPFPEVEAVVFDVLGTLVDEPGGLRAAIAQAVPDGDPDTVERLLSVWRTHVETEQRRIVDGRRDYVKSDVLDAEAADLVAERAGVGDRETVARLATAGRRLPAWPDSVVGLEAVSRGFPVVGLSNSSRGSGARLSAYAGLRWHGLLSGEAVRTYKPAAEVYRLALDTLDCSPRRVLMVAAHAWDLRAARTHGMRTAYIPRPGGHPPDDPGDFDAHCDDLPDLAELLAG